MKRIVRQALLLTALLALAGCAVRVWNQPATPFDASSGYDFQTRLPVNDDELFVVLAFSGGGTRSAAFAYGVLEKLRNTPVVIRGKARRLLDEVDVITSVSGGSFTAAYYGLFGERIFTDFEQRFLRPDVQGELRPFRSCSYNSTFSAPA